MKEEVIEIDIKDIKDFPNHPFKITDDEWKINLKCNYYKIKLQLNKEVVRHEQKIKKLTC